MSFFYNIYVLISLAILVILIIALCVFIFIKKRKAKLNKKNNIQEKDSQKIKKPYIDVTHNVFRVSKNKYSPSFLYFYEGNMDEMLKDVNKITNIDSGEVIIIDSNHCVIIERHKIIFLVTLEGIESINIDAFNTMLVKLYNKGAMQLPIVLIHATTNDYVSRLYTQLQKLLAQLQIFLNHPYSVHLKVADYNDSQDIEALFDLLKYDTSLSIDEKLTKEDTVKLLLRKFSEIRNIISVKLCETEEGIKFVNHALRAASNIESETLPAAQFISEFISGSCGQAIPENFVVNFGIHPQNYYNTFFDYGSKSYKRSFKAKHAVIPLVILASSIISYVFIYNAYKKNEFNQFIRLKKPFSTLGNSAPDSAQKVYNQWSGYYRGQLLLSFLYNQKGNHALNELYANYLFDKVLMPGFVKADDYLDKAIQLSMIVSVSSSAVASNIIHNLKLVSLVSGLTEFQLDIIYNYKKNDNDVLNNISRDLYVASDNNFSFQSNNKIMDDKLFDSFYVQDHFHATNRQIRQFISKNVISHQEICLLQKTIPEMLTSQAIGENENLSRFLLGLAGNFMDNQNYCSSGTALLDLQNLIPEKQLPIKSFFDIIEQMFNYNKKIDDFFVSKDISQSKEQSMKKVLISAQLNTILVDVLNQNQNQINLLDPDDYYQYSFKQVFSRNVSKVSLVYSKNVILNSVLPLIQRYKNLVKILNGYGIDYSAFDRIENGALTYYADQYVQMLNGILRNALPTKVSLDNLQMFLIDITSSNTPFTNMLDYVKNNTEFDKSITLPQELQIIPDSFGELNNFVGSDNYKSFQQILSTISHSLYQKSRDNYVRLYAELDPNKKDSLLSKLNNIINSLGMKNHEAYELFQFPTEIIQSSVADFLLNTLKQKWDLQVLPNIALVKDKFPLNLKSTSNITSDALNDMFGPQGVSYNEMYELLHSFIKLNKLTNLWEANDNLTKSQNKIIQPYIKTFNYFYELQTNLWDKEGKAIPIKIFIKPQPFKYVTLDGITKMVLTILQISDKTKVLGLNTHEDSSYAVSYNWQLQPISAVGWLSSSNVTYQKTYQGEWAFFKMLADANCTSNWLCSWKIRSDNTKVAPFVVSYQFKSNILDLIKR